MEIECNNGATDKMQIINYQIKPQGQHEFRGKQFDNFIVENKLPLI